MAQLKGAIVLCTNRAQRRMGDELGISCALLDQISTYITLRMGGEVVVQRFNGLNSWVANLAVEQLSYRAFWYTSAYSDLL